VALTGRLGRFGFVTRALMSTKFADDLLRLNPFLPPDALELLRSVTVGALTRCLRITQLRRCVLLTGCAAKQTRAMLIVLLPHSDIQRALVSAEGAVAAPQPAEYATRLVPQWPQRADPRPDRSLFSLSLMSRSLGEALARRRCFMAAATGAEAAGLGAEAAGLGAGSPATYALDPRMLVFEFANSLLLRQSQVQLAEEYCSTVGRSEPVGLCHQVRDPLFRGASGLWLTARGDDSSSWARARPPLSRRCWRSCWQRRPRSSCSACRVRCSTSRAPRCARASPASSSAPSTPSGACWLRAVCQLVTAPRC
jgi:hypothetical protein